MFGQTRVGKVFKFEVPEIGEESVRYICIEDNGSRGLFRLVCNLPIAPTTVFLFEDMQETE